MKKELKSGILSADKSADDRPINRQTVGRLSFVVNVIAVLSVTGVKTGQDKTRQSLFGVGKTYNIKHKLQEAFGLLPYLTQTGLYNHRK